MPPDAFDLNYDDVELINQPSGMSCWAASAAMIVGWRERVSIDPLAIVAGAGIWSAYASGLRATDIQTLMNAWQLFAEPLQCYSVDGLRGLLSYRGPLWVAAAVPAFPFHAIVVTGLYSDGSDDGTFVRINDPWDRDPGTPGNPGAYLQTHDRGSQYVLTLQQFSEEYETPASYPGVTVQVLHSNGR
jgi:hypothetical protein